MWNILIFWESKVKGWCIFHRLNAKKHVYKKPNCIHRLSLSLTLYSSLDKPWLARHGEGRAQHRRGPETREASPELGGPGQSGASPGPVQGQAGADGAKQQVTCECGARPGPAQAPAPSRRAPPGPAWLTADRLCNFTILPQNLDRVPIKDKENFHSEEKR